MKYSGVGIAISAFMALLPFLFSRHLFYGAINAKYFFLIITFSLLFIFCAYRIFSGKHTVTVGKRFFLFLIGLLVMVYFLAALTGVFPERSFFSDIVRSSGIFFLTYAALLAFILSEFLKENDWTLLRRSIAVSGGVFGVLSMIGVNGLGYGGRFLWMSFGIDGFTLGNSTFAGIYLVLALIVALIELSRSVRKTRWFSILAASVILMLFSPTLFNISALWDGSIARIFTDPFVLMGGARASSVTAWAIILFLIGRFGIKRLSSIQLIKYAKTGWSALWIMGMFVGVALLFTGGSFVQESYIRSSTGARIIVWDEGFEAWRERPLLGWGSENFNNAFESHFDNRLYLDENIGEVWFDKAHNIFVDTLVEVGILGLAALLALILYFLVVVRRALKLGKIRDTEAILLGLFPFAHILQLQTGFDTPATYTLLAILGGYVLWHEREMIAETLSNRTIKNNKIWQKSIAALLFLIGLLGSKYLFLDEYTRQFALFKTFTTTESKAQEKHVRNSLSQVSDFESLRLSSASFVRGVLEQISAPNFSKETGEVALTRLALYEDYYRAYLKEIPDYYRARMNLTYILLTQTVLGKNKIEEARAIIKDSYTLSPENPLTFAMDALADLYSGNIKGAKEKAQEAIALNPDISFSKEVLAHILKQEKTFPTISVLRLENI